MTTIEETVEQTYMRLEREAKAQLFPSRTYASLSDAERDILTDYVLWMADKN